MADEFNPASARVAAGALFYDGSEILLVKPTYKRSWDIPGGYVEPGESPWEACRREVREELGLSIEVGRLLVVDWAPQPSDGEKILFVFDGGRLTHEQLAAIRVDGEELSSFQFVPVDEIVEVVTDRLTRRLTASLEAAKSGHTLYLEQGSEARSS